MNTVTTNDQTTARSPLFVFADRLVDELAARDPLFATMAGVAGYDDQLPDFSVEHQHDDERMLGESLRVVEAIEPTDDVDRIAKAVIVERLSSDRALLRAGEVRRTFSVISSPLSEIRQVFELMDARSPADAAVIATRLDAVASSLASWRGSLANATSEQLPSRRHVLGVADQASTYADGSFAELAQRVAIATGVDLDGSGLRDAAAAADRACGELAQWLRSTVAPRTTTEEGCGRERYVPWARYFTGAELDLEELYQWGWEESRRIHDRMVALADSMYPGVGGLREASVLLDQDPDQLIDGTQALLARLRSFVDAAVERLDGVHFDIDPRVRFCDVRLAPEGSASAAYYIPVSEDLSRPGTTWYPTMGATTFAWWRFPATWYHEAVPGHHLQAAIAMLAADRQSRFHRLRGWTSGYGEGWALYAERLMEELDGYASPAEEFGYLAGQALRANRIVVDVGLHLGLDAPDDLGVLGSLGDCSARPWTAEMAVALLEEWAIEEHASAVSEVDRYLGMPGQAISYKVGQRRWLEVRDGARARLGARFDLKSFHQQALVLGPLGLDLFAAEMAAWSTDAT